MNEHDAQDCVTEGNRVGSRLLSKTITLCVYPLPIDSERVGPKISKPGSSFVIQYTFKRYCTFPSLYLIPGCFIWVLLVF